MQRYLLFLACLFTLLSATAQYTVGDKTITYTDAARSNRSVGVQFRFPGTNTAVTTGAFPFIIFAHGFSMDQAPYYPYADSLAKRGYIVGLLTTETGLSPSHANFAQDLLFVYNKLVAENSNSASFFYQHVVPKGAIGGHSMGGGSTVLSAQYGNPQVCSFTFAAATTNPSSITAAHLMTKPYLSFAGSRDCIAPIATNQQPMYDSSGSACKFLVNITDGLHCQYGNANTACSFGEGASFCASSPLTRAQQINKTLYYLIPYFDYYLKGDCSAWTLFESRWSSNTVDALQRNCTNTIPSNPAINGTPSFCTGNNTVLTAAPAGFTYLWSDNTTAGTLTASAAGAYSLAVGNGTCTLPSVSVSVTENFPPATPSAITAADSVCSSITNISVSVVNDPAVSTYNWTLPAGWSIVSGNNTNSLQLTSGNTGGVVSVTAQNNCGTTASVQKTITVTPSNLGTPGAITGNTDYCAGQAAQFTIDTVGGADTYVWNLPSGWVWSTTGVPNQISGTAGSASGSVTVQAVNECGQSSPATLNVTVLPAPVISNPISGTDSVCSGDAAVLSYSVPAVANADSLIWSVNNNWTVASGQGTNSVTLLPASGSTTISVSAYNTCGVSTPQTLTVTVLDTPTVTINAQTNQLTSQTSGVAYQWYLDGNILNGENGISITPAQSGNYAVEVTDANGCSGLSQTLNFIYNGLEETSFNSFSISPNPNTTGNLHLTLTQPANKLQLKIIDVTGKEVLAQYITSSVADLNIATLSKGMYLLTLTGEGRNIREKLLID